MNHHAENQTAGAVLPSEGSGHYTPRAAFLEFGSTTIKFYLTNISGEEAGQVEREIKVPWDLGYDVFQHQRISPTTITRCLATLRRLQADFPEIPFETVTAVGTAALREAQNVEVFQRVLWEELRLRIRIIEGGIEAFLLETSFRDAVDTYPTALFDLGGGSLEFVEYLSPHSTRKTSVQLGAIRLHCQLRHTRDLMEYIREGRRIAEETLRDQLLDHALRYRELTGTAGTVRAIVKLLGRDEFTRDDLRLLLQREVHGPSWNDDLQPHRRKVFLPGLLIVESLFPTLGIEKVTYKTASVKRGLINLVSMLPAMAASPGR
jgi:exopolyphosphatase/guanosine-5'-triphosphate,3'-diphosphate pyrophosphatase